MLSWGILNSQMHYYPKQYGLWWYGGTDQDLDDGIDGSGDDGDATNHFLGMCRYRALYI